MQRTKSQSAMSGTSLPQLSRPPPLTSRSVSDISWSTSNLDETPKRRLSWSEICPISTFLCPITGRLLQDPVITADGHSYEKSAIENWFKTGSKSSPMTGSILPHTSIIKNHGLRAAINEYMSKLKDQDSASGNPTELEEENEKLHKEIEAAEKERLRLMDDLSFLEKKFIARAGNDSVSSNKKKKDVKKVPFTENSVELDGLPIWLQKLASIGLNLEESLEQRLQEEYEEINSPKSPMSPLSPNSPNATRKFSKSPSNGGSISGSGGGGGSVSMGAFGALAAEELTMLCDEALRIAVNRKQEDILPPRSPINTGGRDVSTERTSLGSGENFELDPKLNLAWMPDQSDEVNNKSKGNNQRAPPLSKYHPQYRQQMILRQQQQQEEADAAAAAAVTTTDQAAITAIVDEEENQIEVLSEMFRCFDGKQWKEQKGWGEHPQHLGAWFGVCVQRKNKKKVSEIRLGFNNLTGKFPPISLCKLVNLRVLDLQRNYINGPFPHTLPTSLVHLELKDNRLSGQIPSPLLESFTELIHLSLGWNRLSGPLPEFGRLRSLHTLDLSGNMLHGRIPSSIAHLSACRNLWLHSNRFTGLIPTELADLRSLRTLSLSENQFIGNIPAELGTLIYLKKLLLAKNKLNGRIPYELGSLQNLEFLLLTGNKFTDPTNAAGRLQRHLPNCRIDFEV